MKVAICLAGATLFVVLATANAGGYRYGVSDQAYYIAAILKAQTPALFPRDSAILATQSSLLASNVLFARAADLFGLTLPEFFALAQVGTLLGLASAAVAFARRLGFSWWTTAMFLALLTIRHHIEKTGANTLEGYFHPRVLAFACGLGTLAAVLGRRPFLAALALLVALVVHPTTAVWFGIVAATTVAVGEPAWRRPLLVLLTVLGALAAWFVTVGPLAGHLTTMDPAWLAAFADRDYLFSSDWPAYAWAINLGYLVVIVVTYRQRRTLGRAVPLEGALVGGWLTLTAVFLLSVPFSAAHVALAVQAQVNRVFWLLDVMATAYAAWWLSQGPLGSRDTARAAVLGVVLILSAARGWYVLGQANDRALVAMNLPDSPWTDAMSWLRTQPIGWNVLADPGHAWKNGSSVRVAAARDTVLEAGKDPALAIYDRSTALRVTDRLKALEGFADFTTADMTRVAKRYGADVVVRERAYPLDLPVLYSNRAFVVYDVR